MLYNQRQQELAVKTGHWAPLVRHDSAPGIPAFRLDLGAARRSASSCWITDAPPCWPAATRRPPPAWLLGGLQDEADQRFRDYQACAAAPASPKQE